ncbi:hypothetical protein DFH94DRAFT_776851 [Russula ochroleuca]|uniref:Secreted protein n=1 Tax=Russula ochroleuca TaxID=152965 RepID=A0A9P5JXR7_9AGAM|nr:hypothetical protein DFH94DRAFT_776851 [Russula ochroleuca]
MSKGTAYLAYPLALGLLSFCWTSVEGIRAKTGFCCVCSMASSYLLMMEQWGMLLVQPLQPALFSSPFDRYTVPTT